MQGFQTDTVLVDAALLRGEHVTQDVDMGIHIITSLSPLPTLAH